MKRGQNHTPPRPKRGRPLSFDRAAALRKALELFWKHGYETTSISELTAAMNVTPPSLYAAFGDKETLFREAVDCYVTEAQGIFSRILGESATARDAIHGLLTAAAHEYTVVSRPPGCFVLTAAVNCSAESAKVQDMMREHRVAMGDSIRRRIEKGRRAGEFRDKLNAADWAAFYYTVLRGMSTQARDGASRKQLLAIADHAMRAWPD